MPAPVYYIGIDPGKGGGIAVLDELGAVRVVWKMPATERDLIDALQPYSAPDLGPCPASAPRAFAVLERVSASPQMGVVSAFTFGKGYGRLLMALTAARIPFDEVTPQTWQKVMQCLSRGDKNVTKRRAQQLFPSLPAITHYTADALLLAECCRRLARQGALGTPSIPARKDRSRDGKEGSKRKIQTAGKPRRVKGLGKLARLEGLGEELRRLEEFEAYERTRGRGSRQGRR